MLKNQHPFFLKKDLMFFLKTASFGNYFCDLLDTKYLFLMFFLKIAETLLF